MQRSIGDLVGQGAAWFAALPAVAVVGGQAIISVFALLVVTPVVAFYLLVDWDRMVATVDALAAGAPPRHRAHGSRARSTRRSPASSAGRRSSASSSARSMPSALSLIGLNFGALIGMIGRAS